MALGLPTTPVAGQQFKTWTWDGVKWTPTKADRSPRCGRMQLPAGQSNSNTMMLVPCNGDQIKIAGLIYKIPAAGISAVATACYIDKVMGALSPGQWFVYAFVHATAGLQLSFSRTGRATSTTPGNIGTEIRSGDNTQTLVGIIEASGAAPNNPSFHDDYTYRHTRSWFNRRHSAAFAVGTVNASVAAHTPLVAVFVVGFADDVIAIQGQFVFTATANGNFNPNILINSATYVGINCSTSTPNAGGQYVTAKSHAVVQSIDGRSRVDFTMWVDYGPTGGGSASVFATLTGPTL